MACTLQRTFQVGVGSGSLRLPGGKDIFTVLRHRFRNYTGLAQLRPGESAPSLFPPQLCFGGPGAPPHTAAEVNSRQSHQKIPLQQL